MQTGRAMFYQRFLLQASPASHRASTCRSDAAEPPEERRIEPHDRGSGGRLWGCAQHTSFSYLSASCITLGHSRSFSTHATTVHHVQGHRTEQTRKKDYFRRTQYFQLIKASVTLIHPTLGSRTQLHTVNHLVKVSRFFLFSTK